MSIPPTGPSPFQPNQPPSKVSGAEQGGGSPLAGLEIQKATPEQKERYSQSLERERETLETILDDSPVSSPETLKELGEVTESLHSRTEAKKLSLQETEKRVRDLDVQVGALTKLLEEGQDLSAMSKDDVAAYLADQNTLLELQRDLIDAQKSSSRVRDELSELQQELNDTVGQYAESITYVNNATSRINEVSREQQNLEDKTFSLTITAQQYRQLDNLEEALGKGGEGLGRAEKRTYDFISKRLLDKIKGLSTRMEAGSEARKNIREDFLVTAEELKLLAPALDLSTEGLDLSGSETKPEGGPPSPHPIV